jgi:cyclopropane-fatty-acyl-phospholipid synthase
MSTWAKNTFIELLDKTINFSFDIVEGGNTTRVGTKTDTESKFTLKINNPNYYGAVLAFGNLGMGEAYMQKHFEMERGKIEDFLEALLACKIDKKLKSNMAMATKVIPFRVQGFIKGQWHNVQHHYDIGMDLFYAFLDKSLTYSCGYAENENDSTDQLQKNKFDRICRKLQLKEGERLLDIGCGYGGMLIYAAEHFGISGIGVTNSKNHCDIGNKVIKEKGLDGKIKIELRDFKDVTGTFDKIVSVGMLEHVPRKAYDKYFGIINNLLKEGGRGLVHCVGANSFINDHDYFIQKYIFPMSNQPRLSEMAENLEKKYLAILDVENMIRHYGYTAQHWLNDFKKNRDSLTNYTQEFLNMWEYYLACCVAAAKASDSALYQVLFMKNHATPIPLKRV